MFETAQATNIADLFSKLNTFAVAAGWTLDHSASDRLFLTRGTTSVAFRWSTTSPTCAGVYQHTAFINSSTDPGNHTNDSGQGAISGTNATLLTGRNVPLVNSTMTYWFFESDTGVGPYIHVVVEYDVQRYSHFGFGALTKFGSWTGGEYSYGHHNESDSHNTDFAVRPQSTFLLDGCAGFVSGETTVRPFCAVVHAESLPNQTASGKWGLIWGGTLANTGTDRGSTARENIQGGYRGGTIAKGFARYGGSPTVGLVPASAIELFYDDRSNTRWYPLGYMPDVRSFNVKNYIGGDEITIGGDTWVAFPARYKNTTLSVGGTANLGVIYKKVTT